MLKNREVRTAGMYTFSNFFAKGLSFLLIPVFTNPRFLTPADNGLLSLYSQSVLFVLPLLSLGLLQTASVDYFTRTKGEFQDFCVTALTMAGVMSLISLALFYLLGERLIGMFHFPVSFLWAIPLMAFLNFLFDFVMVILRNQESVGKYLKMSMVRSVTELGLAVLLIVVFSFTWGGRVAGLLVSTAFTAGFGLYYLHQKHYLRGRFSRQILRDEIRFSLPVITMQMSVFCLASASTFLLAASTSNTNVIGVFGLAMIFGSVITTFAHALIQYFVPGINRELARSQPNYPFLFSCFKRFHVVIGGWFLLLLLLVPAIYRLFIHPLYHSGIPYYYYISGGLFFWSSASFLYRFPLFFKRKKTLLIVGLLSMIVSLISGYFLTRRFGAVGAAVSVLLSYLFVWLLLLWVTRDHLKKMFLSKPH